jgi:hypothetical protein
VQAVGFSIKSHPFSRPDCRKELSEFSVGIDHRLTAYAKGKIRVNDNGARQKGTGGEENSQKERMLEDQGKETYRRKPRKTKVCRRYEKNERQERIFTGREQR